MDPFVYENPMNHFNNIYSIDRCITAAVWNIHPPSNNNNISSSSNQINRWQYQIDTTRISYKFNRPFMSHTEKCLWKQYKTKIKCTKWIKRKSFFDRWTETVNMQTTARRFEWIKYEDNAMRCRMNGNHQKASNMWTLCVNAFIQLKITNAQHLNR